MYIDWMKIQEKPEIKHKVEGSFLLGLRAKINDLEKKLVQNRDKMEELSTRETKFKDEISSLEAKLNKNVTKNKKKVNKLTSILAELELIVKNIETDKKKLENENKGLNNNILEKEDDLKSYKLEIEVKMYEIKELNKKFEKLKAESLNSKSSTKIIKKIKKKMKHKGFLSDIELEKIIKNEEIE